MEASQRGPGIRVSGAGTVLWLLFAVMALPPALAQPAQTADANTPQRERLLQSLREAEEAFAAAFAGRDAETFRGWLSDDAVFVSSQGTLRGPDEIMRGWEPMLSREIPPPFSWGPTVVEVNDALDLGVTTGPVLGPDGKAVGAFSSVWRRTENGWRIIFDVGPACPVCQ